METEHKIRAILKSICDHCGLSYDVAMSRTRNAEYVIVRNLAMYTARKSIFPCSLETIGAALKKNHTTVLWALKSIKHHIETKDPITMRIYNSCFFLVENYNFDWVRHSATTFR